MYLKKIGTEIDVLAQELETLVKRQKELKAEAIRACGVNVGQVYSGVKIESIELVYIDSTCAIYSFVGRKLGRRVTKAFEINF